VLRPGETWHGFEGIEDGYCMLDPIKVTIVAPGIETDGSFSERGIPAAIIAAYLSRYGFEYEKTQDFTVLFLFAIGMTKGNRHRAVPAGHPHADAGRERRPRRRALCGLPACAPRLGPALSRLRPRDPRRRNGGRRVLRVVPQAMTRRDSRAFSIPDGTFVWQDLFTIGAASIRTVL
jgi:hypothetical protein